MANLLLAYPDRAAAGTLSGGSWVSTLPLSNAQNSVITQVARSVDATNASTQFVLDAGRTVSIGAVGLLNHNLSSAARVRVIASNNATFATTTYDSGWTAAWSSVYATATLEWEDSNWWSGSIDPSTIGTMRPSFVIPMSTTTYGRYWSVQIDDTTNGSGYVQFGRLWLAPSWTVARNPNYGWGLRWEPDAAVAKSLGGTLYFSPRSTARKTNFTLGFMDSTEAYSEALEMQRALGMNSEVLVVSDSADAANLQARSFLARISRSGDVRATTPSTYSVDFELTEVV